MSVDGYSGSIDVEVMVLNHHDSKLLNILWYHTFKIVTVMQVSQYKIMYQLQEKDRNSSIQISVSGGKELKHTLV